MKSSVLGLTAGIVLTALVSVSAPRVQAAEDASATPGATSPEVKALPTLLIKGEIVSVDTSDPTVTLLKVKDRYGFETPIYLAQETKITQGETALTPANLANGAAVEVEYNFDVNTAKRHAVSVKLAAPLAEASPAPAAAPEAAAVPAAGSSAAPATPPAPSTEAPEEAEPSTLETAPPTAQ